MNIGGASPQRGVRYPRQSLYTVIANQYGFVDDPTSNNLLSVAIYSNLVLTVTVNYCIIAPSTVTQHQDTKRELAYIAGVDRYLQGRCSGLAAYLIT